MFSDIMQGAGMRTDVPQTLVIDFASDPLSQFEKVLRAIYNPDACLITHFDGAVRIYSARELEERRREHLRKSGNAWLRRKISESTSLLAARFSLL